MIKTKTNVAKHGKVCPLKKKKVRGLFPHHCQVCAMVKSRKNMPVHVQSHVSNSISTTLVSILVSNPLGEYCCVMAPAGARSPHMEASDACNGP